MIKACSVLGVVATALAWPGAAAALDDGPAGRRDPVRIAVPDPGLNPTSGPELGGPAPTVRLAQAQQAEAAGLHRGVGVVVEAVPGQDMLIVDHEEIPGFMGPMVMGYAVASPELLQGLEAGDPIEFTVDAEKNAIVDLRPRSE